VKVKVNHITSRGLAEPELVRTAMRGVALAGMVDCAYHPAVRSRRRIMTWASLGLTMLAAAVATSLADWLFFGVLFHEKYKAFPEVWRRPEGGAGEGAAVARAAFVSLLTPIAFVASCAWMGQTRGASPFVLALGIWLTAALPMLVMNYFFIKTHPLVTVAHSLGWLVKLLLCAAAVALLSRG
jgi:hypothetical protein